jgi:hypothetical protein
VRSLLLVRGSIPVCVWSFGCLRGGQAGELDGPDQR